MRNEEIRMRMGRNGDSRFRRWMSEVGTGPFRDKRKRAARTRAALCEREEVVKSFAQERRRRRRAAKPRARAPARAPKVSGSGMAPGEPMSAPSAA